MLTKKLNLSIQIKKVFFYDNSFLEYDFLILSPGISYKKNQIEGYFPMDSKNIPACWGVEKINIFKSRLNDLENNSLIIISAPDYPYRCPPAPYERASMIANFLKKKNKIQNSHFRFQRFLY